MDSSKSHLQQVVWMVAQLALRHENQLQLSTRTRFSVSDTAFFVLAHPDAAVRAPIAPGGTNVAIAKRQECIKFWLSLRVVPLGSLLSAERQTGFVEPSSNMAPGGNLRETRET